MILGFTGTQIGMTDEQYKKVIELVKELNPTEAHHGDCIGADQEFHYIIKKHFPILKFTDTHL